MSQGLTSPAAELSRKSVRHSPQAHQAAQATGLFAPGPAAGADWWRQARRERGLATAEVARRLGVSQRYIQSIEAGSRLPGARLMVEATRLFARQPEEWLSHYLATESRCHPLLDLAARLLDAGWLDEAGLALARVIVLGRQFYRGRYTGELCRLAGILRFRQGRARQACLWFSRMERAYGRQGSARRRLQGHFNHALALSGMGRWRSALERLDRAERLSRGLGKERAMIHYARGHLLVQLQSYQEAAAEYRKAGHLLGWQELGFESRLGEAVAVWGWAGARAALPLALDLLVRARPGTQRERALHNVGVLHRQSGDAAGACQFLEWSLAEHGAENETAEASTLAELLLCQVMSGDLAAAGSTMSRFQGVAGAAGETDLASVSAICLALGWPSPGGREMAHLHDSYEGRLGAALAWTAAQRGPLS